MLNLTKVSEARQRRHSKFLHKILPNGAWRNLGVFKDAGSKPAIIGNWIEPYFCYDGIREWMPSEDSTHPIRPDLMIATTNPNHLVIIEAKLSTAHPAIDRMHEGLMRYREYIYAHPDELFRFLTDQGFTDEYISHVAISFSGVSRTRKDGLREQMSFPLF